MVESKENTFAKFADPVTNIEPKVLYGRGNEINSFFKQLRKAEGYIFGYYGLAGIGKTSMLHQFARIAHSLGAYVIYLDFSASASPRLLTVSDTITYILRQLAYTLEVQGYPNGKFIKSADNLGQSTGRTLVSIYAPRLHQIFNFDQSRVIDSSFMAQNNRKETFNSSQQNLNKETAILAKRIRELPTRKMFLEKNSQGKERPFLVILADALDEAPFVHDWLKSLKNNDLASDLILVVCGNDPINNLLDTRLDETPPIEVLEMLRKNYKLSNKDCEAVLELCHGIPMALVIASSYLQDFPHSSLEEMISGRPFKNRTLITAYLWEKYLSQLEDPATLDSQKKYTLYMLKYASVLRRWEGAGQLRAVLSHLKGTNNAFDDAFDYDQAIKSVQQKTFMVNGELHRFIRDLAVRRLYRQDREVFNELHERAFRYYNSKDNENLLEAEYHRLAYNSGGREAVVNAFNQAVIEKDFEKAKIYPLLFDRWSVEACLMRVHLALLGLSDEKELLILLDLKTDVSDLWQKWYKEMIWLVLSQQKGNPLFLARIKLLMSNSPKGHADALMGLGSQLLLRDELAEAMEIFEEAYQTYENLNDTNGVADSLIMQGKVLRREKHEDALHLYNRVLQLDIPPSQPHRARVLEGIGEIELDRKAYERAKQFLDDAYSAYEVCSDPNGQGNVLLELGRMARQIHEIDSAKNYFTKALSIYPIHIKLNRGIAHEELGEIHLSMKDYESAIGHFKLSLELYDPIYITHRTGVLKNLGDAYRELNKFTDAQNYYRQALAISAETQSPLMRGEIILQLGYIARKNKQYDIAMEYYERAKKFFEEANSNEWLGRIALELAELLRDKNEGLEATNHYEQSLKFYREDRNPYNQCVVLVRLVELKINEKDKGSASTYYRELTRLCSDDEKLKNSFDSNLTSLKEALEEIKK